MSICRGSNKSAIAERAGFVSFFLLFLFVLFLILYYNFFGRGSVIRALSFVCGAVRGSRREKRAGQRGVVRVGQCGRGVQDYGCVCVVLTRRVTWQYVLATRWSEKL